MSKYNGDIFNRKCFIVENFVKMDFHHVIGYTVNMMNSIVNITSQLRRREKRKIQENKICMVGNLRVRIDIKLIGYQTQN